MTAEGAGQVRRLHGAVLIVDIAGNVALRTEFGDAAAGRRIRHLLDHVILEVRAQGGSFIKSYGDDVLAVYEAEDGLARAAQTAIQAQRLADSSGLELYAGLHAGLVELGETMGHPVALGQTVNFAARLHKLTEDAPGHIFLTEDSVMALPQNLRHCALRYGRRTLKGLGAHEIWTLEWRDASVGTAPRTAFAGGGLGPATQQLLLRHQGRDLQLPPDEKPCIVGRAAECAVRIADPQSLVSSRHLLLQSAGSHWLAQDISRNGSWLRQEPDGVETLLPSCTKTSLPRRGSLCLGRRFADDPEGLCSIHFEIGAG
jgi:adenylate cyclase